MLRPDFNEAGVGDRFIWHRILSMFLDWDEARIDAWADQFEPGLSDENSLHYHESATWYVSPLLIPKDIADQLSFIEFRNLRLRLEGLIFPDWPSWNLPEELETYDWVAAKQRVDTYLEDLRSRLSGRDSDGRLAADWPE